MKSKKMIDSFNYAIEGILYAFKTQRNMKIHIITAIVVIFASLFFNLSKSEFLCLTITITLVIFAELVNTAVENVVDLMTDKYHHLAEIAKNVAAGSVLIASVNAVVTGYILFFYKLDPLVHMLFYRVRTTNPYVIFSIIFLILLITIVLKNIFNTAGTTPLRGGMPSGHAALSFGIATSLGFLTSNTLICTLGFILAFMVAQSRVEGKIHTFYEVLTGALLGSAISAFIFALIRIR